MSWRGESAPTTGASTSAELRALLLDGTPVTERRIELAGVSTAVIGVSSGPPMVQLHGQGALARSFLPITEPLPLLAAW